MGGRRVREIEAARGIAALGILIYHATQLTGDGEGLLAGVSDRFWLGVPLFFVLSGFLLYRPFARATLHGSDWPSVRRYGRSRLLRIAPAYLLALTVAIFLTRGAMIAAALTAIALALWARALLRGTTLLVPAIFALPAVIAWVATPDQAFVLWAGLTNYLLVFLPLGSFSSLGPYGVIGPAWSLCVEIAFYAGLPLLAIGIDRVARRGTSLQSRARRVAALTALLLPAGIAYLSFAGYRDPLPDWLPGYIQLFAIGMLFAIGAEVWPVVSARSSMLLLAAGIGVALAAQPLYALGPEAAHGNGSSVGYAPVMAAAFALVLASVVLAERTNAVGRLLATRPLVAVGVISYGVFLWHYPLIKVLRTTPLWTSELPNTVLVLVLTLAAATGSWYLVERRALALKDRPLPLRRLVRQPQQSTPTGEVALAD